MLTPYDRLRQARIAAGFSQAVDAADAMGVPRATYIAHENGNRGISALRAKQYARKFKVSEEWLLYGKNEGAVEPSPRPIGPQIRIKGKVAAGRWAEAVEALEDEWGAFTGRADATAELQHRFGLEVVGDSMSEVYPEGTILDCVSVFGNAEAVPGKRVIIVRQRASDMCYEATCKELVSIDGVLWARPRSYNPAHEAFRLDQPQEGIIEIRITAVVIGSYRPE